MQVFFIPHFRFRPKPWRWHKDASEEKHWKRISSFWIPKNELEDFLLICPKRSHFFIDLLLSHELLWSFFAFFGLMTEISGIVHWLAFWSRISWFLSLLLSGIFSWCNHKYLVCTLFFNGFGKSIAIWAFILDEWIKKLNEFSKWLYWRRSSLKLLISFLVC